MALNITHQIGSLAGTKVPSDSTSGDSAATVSAAAVWKSPATNLRCKVMKSEVSAAEVLSPPMSPCRSPVLSGIRPDLSVACQAFVTETAPATEKEYGEGGRGKVKGKGVPVYVMMPLDSVTAGNTVNRKKAMNVAMAALKSAGVEGVMMDVWWGLVEREAAGEYNWGGYVELMEMAKKHGLKVQAVMSFHQCGGNVGDSCK